MRDEGRGKRDESTPSAPLSPTEAPPYSTLSLVPRPSTLGPRTAHDLPHRALPPRPARAHRARARGAGRASRGEGRAHHTQPRERREGEPQLDRGVVRAGVP